MKLRTVRFVIGGGRRRISGVQRGQRREQESGEKGDGGFYYSETGLHAMRPLITVPPNWLSCLKRPAW